MTLDEFHNFDLSEELDKARELEEHYRDLMLWWKRKRQLLEAQIPDIHNEVDKLVAELWDGEL